MPNKSQLLRCFLGGLIFLVTFIIYIKTLCPTVAPRDSGELITAAYTLGIAHPPGYPLYVLLGKLFAFIPFGSIAWRVNLMSAFFASSAVTVAYFIILNLTRSILAGAVGSLLLGFSPIFWSLAVVAEVFQLNAFFTALTIYLLLIWKEKKDLCWLLFFAFIYGLSLTNHHTMFFLAPGFLYFIWITEKEVLFKLKNWLYLGACFVLGLLPYIFLPLRSLQNPYLDWGDPQTLDRFIAVVTRRQFGSLKLDPALPKAGFSIINIFADLKVYLGWLINQFTWLGFALGLAGIIALFRQNKKLLVYLSIIFLLTGLGFVFLANYPLDDPQFLAYCQAILRRFMLPSFLIYALWVGFGAAALINWFKTKNAKTLNLSLLLLIPLVSLTMHYKSADKSQYYFTEDLAQNIFTSLKPGSIIFTNADTTLFSMWYLQGVEGQRPDVKLISTTQHKWRAKQMLKRWPDLVQSKIEAYPSGDAFLADIIKTNLGKAHIYTDYNDSAELAKFFRFLAPHGITYKILASDSNQAKLAELNKSRFLWGKYAYRSSLSTADTRDYFTKEILTLYAEAHNHAGVVYAISGQYQKAKAEFEKAVTILADYQPALTNLRKLRQIR